VLRRAHFPAHARSLRRYQAPGWEPFSLSCAVALACAGWRSHHTMSSSEQHDPYLALRHRDFRIFVAGRFIITLGEQMLTVAIGWEMYQRTHSALALGLVGLVQIVPVLLFSLPAGQVADRMSRKHIVLVTQTVMGLGAAMLALLSAEQGAIVLVFATLVLLGTATAFYDPASSSLLSQTVPAEVFANAATWSSSSWQFAAVTGPALGGFIIAFTGHATAVYIFDAIASGIYFCLLFFLHDRQVTRAHETPSVRSLSAGVGFVWRTKTIMAAITLDLFAVLLGGATTLLPIYAEDILHVGPVGLGWLRAAPSIGAVVMALSLAHLPPFKRTGWTLLVAVAGFGLATIIFGISRVFPLSLAMLVLLGGLDNISVVVRSTLLLLRTPDEMRGRIAAINSVFVGSSNQLGGFESGLAAALFGPILAVVGGGIGTILVVIAVALIWPEIRRLGRLTPAVLQPSPEAQVATRQPVS
jgi:MFS family permease